MNYLAHVFLSRSSPEGIVGGMLGDFVKGRGSEMYSAPVRAAIELHRAVDRYTDAHPQVCASRARISSARRRFAGIMVDVFYDHFLACHWQDYSDVPLEQFTRQVYAVLARHAERFPPRLQQTLPRMRDADWLASYAELEAVDLALRGIAHRLRRFPRAAVLCDGAQELSAHYRELERDFSAFFPELVDYAARWTGTRDAS